MGKVISLIKNMREPVSGLTHYFAALAALVGLAALVIIGRRVWQSGSPLTFAIFIGLLGWFVQGLGEFSLYVPALAWTAFALLGCSLGRLGVGSEY